MDETLLTKQSWCCGLLVAGFQMLVIVLICYLRLVVEMFRRREYLVGALFAFMFLLVGGGWTLGVLAGLPVGWRYARRWGIRPWMAVWTLAMMCGLCNIAAAAWLHSLSVEQWQAWFV